MFRQQFVETAQRKGIMILLIQAASDVAARRRSCEVAEPNPNAVCWDSPLTVTIRLSAPALTAAMEVCPGANFLVHRAAILAFHQVS